MHIDDRVIFIHNPRASGTSIRRALARGKDPNRKLPYPANRSDSGKHAFARQAKAQLAEGDSVVGDIWDSRFKFAVVRNPWDRMVSLYGLFRRPTERRHQLTTPKKTPYKLNKLIDALTNKRVSYGMGKGAKRQLATMAFGLGFKEWIAFCDEYHWNGCPYLDTDLPMIRIPQVEWFEGLDRVFRFEDRDALDECLDDMGYPVAVPENQTVHEPWQRYYDADTYDLVAKAFQEDIARFGY